MFVVSRSHIWRARTRDASERGSLHPDPAARRRRRATSSCVIAALRSSTKGRSLCWLSTLAPACERLSGIAKPGKCRSYNWGLQPERAEGAAGLAHPATLDATTSTDFAIHAGIQLWPAFRQARETGYRHCAPRSLAAALLRLQRSQRHHDDDNQPASKCQVARPCSRRAIEESGSAAPASTPQTTVAPASAPSRRP